MFPSLPYHVLMAAVVAGVLLTLRRLPSTWMWVKACADTLLAAVALAAILASAAGQRSSGILRLASYGLFLYGPVMLVGSAWLVRRVRPKTAAVSVALAVAGGAIVVDAFLIEPTWLEVTHVRIATPKITRPVRIVVLADLQTDTIGPYEREVLHRALLERPDLILLAGDYLQADEPLRQQLSDELNGLLRQIGFSAPGGVFAVRGNVDGPDWKAAFDGLPITAVETRQSFDVGQLRLTCLSERDSFRRWTEVPGGDPKRFHLVLGHAPSFALGRIDADLLVAGHTHGGQVCLPLWGPVITPSALPNRQSAGLVDLPGGAQLYVSRGIGMERGDAPRMRFFCRPELTVLELVPQ